ncbi:MAG: hypothetical protein KF799_12080 [Bdellovibrionales bacterium]|nr:hypothetical protein [Bdellovibrionales bacterium]
MKYFWAFFGWVWKRKVFFAVMLSSAVFFFAILFPFSDLSDVVTTTVARATGNQVYVQFDELNLHIVPQPAISATKLSVETALPPLEAQWAKITPSLFSALMSLPTMISAAGGNAEAAASLGSKLGATIDAEGILGGDIELRLRSGSKTEGGRDRSRISLAVDKVNLGDVQKWSDLPVEMSGIASLTTDVQMTTDLAEQPDGDYNIQISKFALPASTVPTPMGPLNVPTITLANVVLKGKLSNGTLMIDEGSFGQAKDPIFGRIKGSIGMRLQQQGPSVFPMFGSYNLTVDLNTTQMIEKDLGIAFILLGPAKTPAPGGGARYLFRASGQGLGMNAAPPSITRLSAF